MNNLGIVAIFGSGETSSVGIKVHELLIKRFKPPVNISLLATPAGFEDNPIKLVRKSA